MEASGVEASSSSPHFKRSQFLWHDVIHVKVPTHALTEMAGSKTLLVNTLLRTRSDEGQKIKRGMLLSPLDTPLRKRSDDDQEMKISAVRSFCVAGGGRAAKQGQAHSGHEYYYGLLLYGTDFY